MQIGFRGLFSCCAAERKNAKHIGLAKVLAACNIKVGIKCAVIWQKAQRMPAMVSKAGELAFAQLPRCLCQVAAKRVQVLFLFQSANFVITD